MGLTPPAGMVAGGRAGVHGPLADAGVLLALFLIASAVWVESDVYRYAAAGLMLWGYAIYFFREKEFRPSFGIMGILCIAWTVYVSLRFLWDLAAKPLTSAGASEGIYFFPLFTIVLGFVFFLYRGQMLRLLALFMAASLASLLATIDFIGVATRAAPRITFLMHENLIHASIGAGFVAIAASLAAQHFAGARGAGFPLRRTAVAVSLAVLGLCLFGVFGAASRGVWFALAASLPLTLAGPFLEVAPALRRTVRLAAVATAAAAAVLLWAPLQAAVGPLLESSRTLVEQVIRQEAIGAAVEHVIAGAGTPLSFNERLILWTKAVGIWSGSWVFGEGIYWRTLWDDPASMKAPYDLMHNGYLEIGVRYGLVGLAFYAVLFGWSLCQSWRAMRRGLIVPGLFGFHAISLVFFLLTLLSNSNNRLAIGESYMLLCAAFGFCCFNLQQWQEWEDASRPDPEDPPEPGLLTPDSPRR